LIFRETELVGALVIDIEAHADSRGFFARTWCQRELLAQGISMQIAQTSMSYNRKKGTLRGLHYQVEPHREAKLIRCTHGAIFDVIVDLRPASATYRKWFAVELTAANRQMLYVPDGFAHGFQTLEDDTEVSYLISEFFVPESGRGARYDDPAFAIEWPLEVSVISEKDASWPDYPT